jgi:anti-sigma B factor antagonist
MKITEREHNGITVFTLEGRIDTEGAAEMDQTLQAATSDGKHKMVLQMAEVTYISSAGLRTLADVVSRNREQGGDLKLVGLTPKVMRVLRIIGFDRFFAVHEHLEGALTEFQAAVDTDSTA